MPFGCPHVLSLDAVTPVSHDKGTCDGEHQKTWNQVTGSGASQGARPVGAEFQPEG